MGGKYYQCLFTRCAKGGLLESLILTAEMYFRRVFCPTEKYVDKFICVSQFVYGKYRQFNSRISAKAVVLHNPVRIPSGHNNNNRGSYLLFIGRLSRERGIETLMNVMKELPHISLKVAGTGDYPKDNIPFNVEFLGFKRHEEVERLIEGARYLLFPSEWYEPFGLSIAECLSLGKPVIASRIGAIPELVEDGKNGFLFEVKDTEGLIGIVRKAWPLADSEYAAMSRYAADSMKKYSSAIYSNKLLTLYHELLGNIEDEDSHSGDKRNSG
jgi:glycosyltransferase involved in cell wall biosynthesis